MRLHRTTLPSTLAAAFLLLAAHATAGAPPATAQFRYQRTLSSRSGQEEIAAATLDPETWAHVRPAAPDLRIATPDGTLVPHLLRRAAAERVRRVRRACSSSVEALRELPDNRIEIDLKIPETSPTADTLILTTPLKDFERRITIDGRNPDGTMERLVTDALIYDYSRFIDLRHLMVEIPRNDFRQLCVTIEAVTDTTHSPATAITRTIQDEDEVSRTESTRTAIRHFRIDTAKLFVHEDKHSNREPVTVDYSHLTWTSEADDKKQTTTYEVATSNLPLTELVISAPARNFSVRATVEAPYKRDGRTQWRTIANATLSRISFRSYSKEALALSFPEQQHPTMRLTLHHNDTPPLPLTAITGRGPQWQALFLAQPKTDYVLFAGSPTAKPPSFDTTHLERLLARDIQPLPCSLSPLIPNPDHDPRAARGTWAWLGSRTLFGIVIAVVIAILAIGLIKASKNALSSEEQAS